ncbi:MAG: hypothetical protein LUH09_05595 [Clostridiales bacterium]|nr:hypothetical protein [Clostridiales bacterium]
MRHSLYANAKKSPVDRSYKASISAIGKNTGYFRQRAEPVKLQKPALENRLKALLTKYKKDPKMYSEIYGKIAMYECNITLARKYHDKKTEKQLERDLLEYIKSKETR